MIKNNYIDYVLDTLFSLELGNMKSRKMFGGYGIYHDGTFFALIANNILYFKVDESNRSLYESHGSRPFTYEGKNKNTVVMSYWEVPVDILENRTKLTQWVQKSVQIARQTKQQKKPKKTKTK